MSLPSPACWEPTAVILLGVDPHKSTHTAAAVAADTQQQLSSVTIRASLPEYRRLLRWARQWSQRTWAVENANGLGRHLVQWLIIRGERVIDVPATATSRVRELSRGGRKNDQIDAAAAATVAHLHGDGRQVKAEDHTTALALLDERRVNLTQARVRAVNQLHALLRDLLPGGAPDQMSADQAAALLRTVRPAGPVEKVRKNLARDLVAEVRGLDKQLTANATQLEELVAAADSTLIRSPGIGSILAARLIARVGRASRFPTAAAFANYTGTAPVESPARTRPATDSPGPEIGSSTPCSTPSPSSRSVCPTRPDTPTTSGNSPRGRPARKRNAA